MTAAVVAEGLAVIVLAVLMYNLLRSQARLLQLLDEAGLLPSSPAAVGPRPPRLPMLGGRASDLEGVDAAGTAVRISLRDDSAVLIFLTTSCSTCQQFWDRLAATGGAALPGGTGVVVVTPGPALERRDRVAQLASPTTAVVMSADAWADYVVTGAPFVVVVERGAVVAESPVRSWDDLLTLLSDHRPQRRGS